MNTCLAFSFSLPSVGSWHLLGVRKMQGMDYVKAEVASFKDPASFTTHVSEEVVIYTLAPFFFLPRLSQPSDHMHDL